MKHMFFIALLIITGYFVWEKTDKDQRPDILLKVFAKLNPLGMSVDIDFYEDLQLSEENIDSRFKHLHFGCGDQFDNLGDRVCWSYISSFNNLPANMMTVFFKNKQYSHIRISTEPKHHSKFIAYLDSTYKNVGKVPPSKNNHRSNLGAWSSQYGLLTFDLNQPSSDSQEVILLWSKR